MYYRNGGKRYTGMVNIDIFKFQKQKTETSLARKKATGARMGPDWP